MMMTRQALGMFALVLACSMLPELARGFSMGAPDSACASMIPGHGNPPQTELSPYRINLTPLNDTNNRRIINVTLTSDQGVEFAGFLLQARPAAGGNALGSFVVDTAVSKTHTCGSGLRAPEDYTGVLVFNASFVRDYSTFWVGVLSEKFRINPRSDATHPGVETSSRKPTTRLPTTSRTPPPVAPTTPSKLPEKAKLASSIYTECGAVKSCFGFGPPECESTQNCDGLVTYQLRADKYEFELFTSAPRLWVAAALSSDSNMGSDSVMECTYENGQVLLHSSWNEEDKGGNHRIPSAEYLHLTNSSYADSNLYCKFWRDTRSTVEGVEFNLALPYYLLVAGGVDFKTDSVGYHGNSRTVTADKILLADVVQVKAASKILVQLHGAFMLLAWIGTASCGILLARYFKQTWIGSQLCGKDQWFAIVGCASDRQGSARVTAFPMKDMGSSRNPLHGTPDRRPDAPLSTLRRVLLGFYIFGAFGFAIALIVITFLAPIPDTWDEFRNMVGLK
ncbi:hypothetical protein B566_EDAN005473 [Ephemera danica]|nr:hypothetical protein B566_EDAN005473 [Ephemera danica]